MSGLTRDGDGQSFLARPNSLARAGTGKFQFPCSADHELDRHSYRLFNDFSIDSHIQRIVLATKETIVTQRVSYRPSKCQTLSWSQRGTKVNRLHHGARTRYSTQQGSNPRQNSCQVQPPENIRNLSASRRCLCLGIRSTVVSAVLSGVLPVYISESELQPILSYRFREAACLMFFPSHPPKSPKKSLHNKFSRTTVVS